jgi:hypothetical protein
MRSITTWDNFKEATPEDIERFFTWTWTNSGSRGDIANAESLMIRGYKRTESTFEFCGQVYPESETTIDFSYWTPKTPDGYGNWMSMKILRRPGMSRLTIDRQMNPVELDYEAYAMG